MNVKQKNVFIESGTPAYRIQILGVNAKQILAVLVKKFLEPAEGAGIEFKSFVDDVVQLRAGYGGYAQKILCA
jgi:hypothetical protein